MFYPKTGELETYWTNYHCEDAGCPGKYPKATHQSYSEKMREWIDLGDGSRKRKRLQVEGNDDAS